MMGGGEQVGGGRLPSLGKVGESLLYRQVLTAHSSHAKTRDCHPFLEDTACMGKYLENKYPRERHLYKDPILSLIFPKGRLKNIVFILFCIFRKDSPCAILSLFSRKIPKDQFS